MLRRGHQVFCSHFLKLTESGLQSHLVKPILEREVVALGSDLQGFQFDKSAE